MKNQIITGLALTAMLSISGPMLAGADGGTWSTAGNGSRANVHVAGRAKPANIVEAFVRNGLLYEASSNGYFLAGVAPALADNGSSTTGYQQGTPLDQQVQAILKRQGYYLGPVDGIEDLRTQQAIEAYQRDHGLTITGQISGGLIDAMGVR
jgi:hypothetical protein